MGSTAVTEPPLLGKGRQPSQVQLPALLSDTFFPALLFLDSNIIGALYSLLASVTAIERVIYLRIWQCWVMNSGHHACEAKTAHHPVTSVTATLDEALANPQGFT